MPAIYRCSNRTAGRGKVMTTGAAVQQIGKGYFSKAKSFPVLKQRREGKRRSDFEKGSDSSPTTPRPHPSYVLHRHSKLFLLSLSLSMRNSTWLILITTLKGIFRIFCSTTYAIYILYIHCIYTGTHAYVAISLSWWKEIHHYKPHLIKRGLFLRYWCLDDNCLYTSLFILLLLQVWWE